MTQTDPSETSKINQVTIYYDLNNDLFGVVNEKTNTFVTWSVALLFDYIDIFYFKWFFNDSTFNDRNVIFYEIPNDLDAQLEESFSQIFENIHDTGLPQNYNPRSWWEDKEKELTKSFLKKLIGAKNCMINYEN